MAVARVSGSDTIPYFWRALDWDRLIDEYPPSPLFEETVGRMSEEALRELQTRRFLARVAEAWRIPFYRERWRDAGLEPGDIASLDDLPKLPAFTSDDLRGAITAAPPFGNHHPFGRDAFGPAPLKIQTSGGTTGKARPTIFDPLAWEVQGIQAARSLYADGARPGHVIQIPMTNALGIGAWNAYVAAFEWLNCVPVTSGSGVITPSELQLEYAKDFGTNGWFVHAEYLGRLVEVAASIGFDLHQLPTVFLQASMGADVDKVFRRQLEAAWGAPVYDRYGSHEIGLVAFDCKAQNGMHLSQDTVIIEIVDPETGKPVAPGEKGNLVATSLYRSVPVFIRYNLRDLFRLYPRSECECGLSTQKVSSFLGRSDEMVKVRGHNLYPRACQPTVAADQRTTGQFLCVARHVDGAVGHRTEVTVQVERRSTDIDKASLAADLATALHRDLGVRLDVEVLEAGELAEATGLDRVGERKIRRLLDLRTHGN